MRFTWHAKQCYPKNISTQFNCYCSQQLLGKCNRYMLHSPSIFYCSLHPVASPMEHAPRLKHYAAFIPLFHSSPAPSKEPYFYLPLTSFLLKVMPALKIFRFLLSKSNCICTVSLIYVFYDIGEALIGHSWWGWWLSEIWLLQRTIISSTIRISFNHL
jgi:hypothetical protein